MSKDEDDEDEDDYMYEDEEVAPFPDGVYQYDYSDSKNDIKSAVNDVDIGSGDVTIDVNLQSGRRVDAEDDDEDDDAGPWVKLKTSDGRVFEFLDNSNEKRR